MKYLATYIILFLSISLVAQEVRETTTDTIVTPPPANIEVNEVEVIKAFEAKLIDAQLITIAPKVPEVVKVEKNYNYDITVVPIDIEYPAPVVKPLAMNPDPEIDVHKFYAKLGYGTLNSPYADVSYANNILDEIDYEIDGHFYGADDASVIQKRQFYEAALGLKVGYVLGENHKLKMRLNGAQDQRFLYDTVGVRDITTSLDELARDVTKLNSAIRFQNLETTESGLDYGIEIGGYHMKVEDFLPTDETEVFLDAGISKAVNDNLSVELNTLTELTTTDNSIVSTSERKAVTAVGGFRFHNELFNVRALADVFVSNSDTEPFVDVEIGVPILSNILQVFVGADQKIDKNTIGARYADNPFTSTLLNPSINTIRKQFYGGVRGDVKKYITYSFAGGYENFDNLAMYRTTGREMIVEFEDGNKVFANGDIELALKDNVAIGGRLSANFYTMDDIDDVYNMPTLLLNTYGKVTLLNDKLKIKGGVDLSDRIVYLDADGMRQTGNSLLDVSAEIDFYATEHIALWVRGNNLLDREYLRYGNYPGFGINLQGGLIIRL